MSLKNRATFLKLSSTSINHGYLWRKLVKYFLHLRYPPAASFLVPGSPAAERAELGPSSGRSSARCCCLSPRLLLTCLTTSARGKNPSWSSRVIANPAQESSVMGTKIEKRRSRDAMGTYLTGSMRDLRSAQRAVEEVRILIYLQDAQQPGQKLKSKLC